MKKKELIFEIIIVIIFVIFLVLFITKKNPIKKDIILTGCLDSKITLSDINLSKNNKMDSSISIKNKCDHNYNYYIVLSVKRDSDSDELVKVGIGNDQMKLTSYDKNIRFNVSTGYLNSYIIEEGEISPDESKTIDLSFSSSKKINWISEIKVVGTSK